MYEQVEVEKKKLLITTDTYYPKRDGVMVFLVMVILFCYQRSFFNIYPWFIKRGKNAEKKDWSGSG